MGKRTKFQQKELPQLILLAQSSRATEGGPEGGEGQGAQAGQGSQASGAPGGAPQKLQHSVDSVLLETTAFADGGLEASSAARLHPLEQAVILARCLDVANSNPRDGLTSEEMAPYVQRVLQQPSTNWMVYSTALLERSWLDFESSYAQDRALLQMQVGGWVGSPGPFPRRLRVVGARSVTWWPRGVCAGAGGPARHAADPHAGLEQRTGGLRARGGPPAGEWLWTLLQ